mgnify:CR=1 FL=1
MSRPALRVLIPAAGASERLGHPKQLVRFRGKPLLQRAIDAARTLSPIEVIVVTGANASAVEDAVRETSVRWIHNPDWAAGMGGSIAKGATAIHPESRGVMILLCDQWRVQGQDLQALVEAWQSDRQRVVVAESQGHYMPPVIFPSALFPQLQALTGQQGARSLLETRAALVTPVAMPHAAADLDSPSHLNELLKSP